ncbi:LAFA_0G20472g1_1 [Lachancea sp. 'fantastica']|nr:LAFA_0G20472g1_1 [Lachancea sp. 'fantastica']
MSDHTTNQNNDSHILNDDEIESIINPNQTAAGNGHQNSQPVVEDIVNPAWDPSSAMSPAHFDPQSTEGSGQGIFSPLSTHASLLPMGQEHSGDIVRRSTPSSFYPGTLNTETERPPIHDSLLSDSILMPYRNRLLKPVAKPQPSVSPKQLPKRKLTSAKTRPAFVNKLWSMVNDTANAELMHWAPDGKSFIITNREGFVHNVLPRYFKHSNFASFVRQLNMYGWHKVQDVRSGSIQENSDERSQFENENFIRDSEELLDNIVRQKSSSNNSKDLLVGQNGEEMDIGILLNELESVKFNQMAIAEDIKRMSKDNELLWKENMMARERHQAQQQALNKILHLLTSLMGSNAQKLLGHDLANQLAQTNSGFNDIPTGNTNYWDLGSMNSAMTRPRLLLKDSQAHNLSKNHMNTQDSVPHDLGRAPSPIQEIGRQYIDDPPSAATGMSTSDAGHSENRNSRTSQSEPPAFDSASSVGPNFFDDLESNIKRQGESIQELEDWITKMSPSHSNGLDSAPASVPGITPDDQATSSNANGQQPAAPTFDLQDYLSTTDPSNMSPLIQESPPKQPGKRSLASHEGVEQEDNEKGPQQGDPRTLAKKQKTSRERKTNT